MEQQWPLILAGPILRRVEPTRVSVWIALREACDVELSIWQGLVSGKANATLFEEENDIPPAFTTASPAPSVRVGDNLHIVVVTCDVDPLTPLLPGTLYSYNVSLTVKDNPPFQEDLHSLGLLQDDASDPLRPHLALGYDQGALPGFAMPPLELDQLKLAHGSCRKPHGFGRDGLSFLDHVIGTNRHLAAERPHQMFMTGDQIYADDVAFALLPKLNEIGRALLGTAQEQLPAAGQLWPATNENFPSTRRHSLILNEASFTCNPDETDAHLLSFGEYCALYLCMWSNAVWPDRVASEGEVFEDPSPPSGLEAVLTPRDEVEHLRKELKGQRLRMIDFLDTLPAVRRALANVPVYTTFDDHDVTDDWNLSREWRDNVLLNPLGRAILRNALIAYGLFQGWGNDPEKFKVNPGATGQEAPGARFIQRVASLFPANAAGPDPQAAADLEALLGLNESDLTQQPDELDKYVPWHYIVQGPKHLVVVTDTRNWRHNPSRHSPPSLIKPDLIGKQIPGERPPGIEVTIVISSMPVLGLPTIEEVLQPAANRFFDAKFATAKKSRDNHAGAEIRDPEPWSFEPYAFEALLKQLQKHKQVVVLSGETHYALTAALSYWKKKGEVMEETARIVQLTASSFKNVEGDKLLLLKTPVAQHVFEGTAVPVERLGWDSDLPNPVSVPGTERMPTPHRNRLDRAPVLLTPRGWPQGTAVERLPDWAWRLDLVRDGRPDAERPLPVQHQPIADLDPANPAPGYLAAAQRHVEALHKTNPRTVLFPSNLGVFGFAGTPALKLTQQSLDDLQNGGLAQDVLEALLPLKDRVVPEANFLSTVKAAIGLKHPLSVLTTIRDAAEQAGDVLAVHNRIYTVHPEDPDVPRVYARHVASLEPTAETEPVIIDALYPTPA